MGFRVQSLLEFIGFRSIRVQGLTVQGLEAADRSACHQLVYPFLVPACLYYIMPGLGLT